MSLAGTWIVINQWSGQPAYQFPATFNKDGTVVVEGGYFVQRQCRWSGDGR